jgi:hypothetical protein
MTNNQKTFEYSEDNGLDYVETTNQSNGYPSNLRYALTFESISELESHAEKLSEQGQDCQRVMLHRMYGWNLWHRQGADVRKGMFRKATSSQSTTEIDICDSADEIAFRIVTGYTQFDTLQELQRTTEQCIFFRNEIEDILSELEDNDQQSATVFYDPDQDYRIDYYATDETASYTYDTYQYKVGLIVNWKEEETNED